MHVIRDMALFELPNINFPVLDEPRLTWEVPLRGLILLPPGQELSSSDTALIPQKML